MKKLPVKYIMGPLLIGGLIMSLYFTITAYHATTATANDNICCKPAVAEYLPKPDVQELCIKLLKRFFLH